MIKVKLGKIMIIHYDSYSHLNSKNVDNNVTRYHKNKTGVDEFAR